MKSSTGNFGTRTLHLPFQRESFGQHRTVVRARSLFVDFHSRSQGRRRPTEAGIRFQCRRAVESSDDCRCLGLFTSGGPFKFRANKCTQGFVCAHRAAHRSALIGPSTYRGAIQFIVPHLYNVGPERSSLTNHLRCFVWVG